MAIHILAIVVLVLSLVLSYCLYGGLQTHLVLFFAGLVPAACWPFGFALTLVAASTLACTLRLTQQSEG